MLNNDFCPKIGEVYQIYFNGYGSVQKGLRPGIIIQNNIGNRYSPNVIAIPLTSAIKNLNQPTHVFLSSKETGLKLDSIALCENPETVSKEMVGKYITTIPLNLMNGIAISIMQSIPVISFLNYDEMTDIWSKTSRNSACI